MSTMRGILRVACRYWSEHAFLLDYDLKRADYIEAFSKKIDWTAVEDRFK
jgi:superoxide dismutase